MLDWGAEAPEEEEDVGSWGSIWVSPGGRSLRTCRRMFLSRPPAGAESMRTRNLVMAAQRFSSGYPLQAMEVEREREREKTNVV